MLIIAIAAEPLGLGDKLAWSNENTKYQNPYIAAGF